MNIEDFKTDFESKFPKHKRETPNHFYAFRLKLKIKKLYWNCYPFDPLWNIEGSISVKKQQLLNLAYKHLPSDEAYLEIGVWYGKSLIAAMKGNALRPTYACDNFSEFFYSKGKIINVREKFQQNLNRHALVQHVHFYNMPFQEIFSPEKLPKPIGLYFYDGAHDEKSQYEAIKMAEPFLANKAIVIVDDWRYAQDSQSFARQGTEKAIKESSNRWNLLWNLPARFNGDRAMWWNGVAVFSFNKS